MSMITLFSAFMGLYVIVRLILPSGMNWPLKLILSLFALACAEKLLLTKLVYGTMGHYARARAARLRLPPFRRDHPVPAARGAGRASAPHLAFPPFHRAAA
ncbi:MAG: hypothetical protein ACLSHC_08125 [Bilophila wadsworthia]